MNATAAADTTAADTATAAARCGLRARQLGCASHRKAREAGSTAMRSHVVGERREGEAGRLVRRLDLQRGR